MSIKAYVFIKTDGKVRPRVVAKRISKADHRKHISPFTGRMRDIYVAVSAEVVFGHTRDIDIDILAQISGESKTDISFVTSQFQNIPGVKFFYVKWIKKNKYKPKK